MLRIKGKQQKQDIQAKSAKVFNMLSFHVGVKAFCPLHRGRNSKKRTTFTIKPTEPWFCMASLVLSDPPDSSWPFCCGSWQQVWATPPSHQRGRLFKQPRKDSTQPSTCFLLRVLALVHPCIQQVPSPAPPLQTKNTKNVHRCRFIEPANGAMSLGAPASLFIC